MLSPAGFLLAGAAGLLLWRVAASDRLVPLARERTDGRCALLFLLGFLLNSLLLATILTTLGGTPDGSPAAGEIADTPGSSEAEAEAEAAPAPEAAPEDEAESESAPSALDDPLSRLGLERVVGIQAAANLLTVLVLVLVARRMGLGAGSLGLRRTEGASSLVLALAAWLAFLPLLAAISLANLWLLQTFGGEVDPSQAYLLAFVRDEAASHSPLVWFGMVAAIPLAEEVLYRGALFGGLLGRLGPWPAMVVSGVLFGIGHDAGAWIPISALGIYLAWLYHRTGSLAVPVLVHMLQNGSTLLLAQFTREISP
ncbi:MAG: CPBP family intramembrane metalloprotease [Planctomycetes bacterium]|nr:CPBP family intramembrane metalloprotease [Planctomycetota bacterium]